MVLKYFMMIFNFFKKAKRLETSRSKQVSDIPKNKNDAKDEEKKYGAKGD